MKILTSGANVTIHPEHKPGLDPPCAICSALAVIAARSGRNE